MMRFVVAALVAWLFMVSPALGQRSLAENRRDCDRASGGTRGTGQRLALVIANSDYNDDNRDDTPEQFSQRQGLLRDLANPGNDGLSVCAALGRLGFEISFVRNADLIRMNDAIARFGARIDAAPSDAVVIIYYAGHAIEVNNVNFLLPVQAQLPQDDLTRMPARAQATVIGARSVPLSNVFQQLRTPTGAGLNLIILDACRDDPWAARFYGQGPSRSADSRSGALARQDPDDLGGTLVAYSTSSGRTASDGRGVNSPYATALLQWIERPGLNVRDLLNTVGLEVQRNSRQRPWMNAAPVVDVCLAGCQSLQAAPSLAIAAAPAPAPQQRLTEAPPPSVVPQATGDTETARSALARVNERDWRTGRGRDVLARLLRDAPLTAYRALAESGDLRAQTMMGIASNYGFGTPHDYAQAMRWFRRAADQGEPRAQNAVGAMHGSGEGVAMNPAEAVVWYRRSAAQSYPWGQYNLGVAHMMGQGVPRDFGRAATELRAAGNSGLPDANIVLGGMYLRGDGVERSYPEAMRLFRLAVAQGSADGRHAVGAMYFFGLGVGQSYPEALRWFRQAADGGSAQGQHSLGSMYYSGRGVTRDYGRARELFERAAEQNVPEAAAALGTLYENGLGVTRNISRAASYYRMAVQLNSADAQYRLGLLLVRGEAGVARNESEGRDLIGRAASAGHQDARAWLAARGAATGSQP